jgi:phage shock protein PspC (stress-responsive transcriptional regulator)
MSALHKSKNNRVLFGVCGGLAETLNIDAPILRLAFVLGAIFSGSVLFWVYLLLALVLPSRD